jgi:hypothetical protein
MPVKRSCYCLDLPVTPVWKGTRKILDHYIIAITDHFVNDPIEQLSQTIQYRRRKQAYKVYDKINWLVHQVPAL